MRIRVDLGATHGVVARAAGIDRSHYSRIESGGANPSLDTIVAIATALGTDVSIRCFPGTGPQLTDRHQAPMVEALLGVLHPVWQAHPEVPVWRPARGVIDVVLERADRLLVAAEIQSELRRLELQLRRGAEKAASLPSSELVRQGSDVPISQLLVLRSTASMRTTARDFERTLRAAFPARAVEVLSSIRDGATWPGPGIVWVRIDRTGATLMDGPPRGVSLGR